MSDIAHKPRLLSDNGSSYIAGDLADWMDDQGMRYVRGAPYQPETLVDIMNDLLTDVSNIIEAHDGYVDKFVGDAVMAVWNAPVIIYEPERAAANAALACRKALDNRAHDPVLAKLGFKKLNMCFGLNAGEAIAGNVGSEQRFNYTVIGDAVNLAARLESANKTYGTSILAGEDLADQLGDNMAMRCVDTVAVVGKSTPVRVYEILGLRADLSEGELAELENFEAGRQAYLERDFASALAQFNKLPKSDRTAQLYCERARLFQNTPPPGDWDGTTILSTK